MNTFNDIASSLDSITQFTRCEEHAGCAKISGYMLPIQIKCEALADKLSEKHKVRVHRVGTGNAQHTGILDGCYVDSIHVSQRA